MKRSNTKFETSITLSKENRDKLKKIKEENDFNTYNEVITNLLSAKQGLIKEYEIIEAPKTALILEHLILGADGVQLKRNTKEITYKELKSASIGQRYYPTKENAKYYYWQSAEVVFKTDDLVVLRLFDELQQEEFSTSNRLVGVEML